MKLILFACCLLSSPLFAEWTPVWSDEFDKPGLPDPSKWSYDEGLIRNKESQHYVRAKKENTRVEDGCLVIEARKEKVDNPDFVSKDHPDWKKNRPHSDYSSGCIITNGLASWKYGKVEIRAKLPTGQGAWPAFWMMGEDRSRVGWPKCGEIDIMEHVTSSVGTVYGTAHYSSEGKHKSHGENIKKVDVEQWHTYGIEWSPEEILWLLDGKPYARFNMKDADGKLPEEFGEKGNCFRKPYYILINLAVGGAWGGPPDPAMFPQKMLVDYVRVYQQDKEAKEAISPEK